MSTIWELCGVRGPRRCARASCACLAAILVFVAALGCKEGHGDSARKRCLEARQVLAELSSISKVSPRVSEERAAAERAKHAANLDRSLGERFVERCLAAKPEYRECVLAAEDRADLRKCRVLLARR